MRRAREESKDRDCGRRIVALEHLGGLHHRYERRA
jgi:hypothetical protein